MLDAVSHVAALSKYPPHSWMVRPLREVAAESGNRFALDLFIHAGKIESTYLFTEFEVQEALDLKLLYSVDYSRASGLYAAMWWDSSGPAEETSFASV